MWNFSLNLQPRLVSLYWLKRSGFRCFAHSRDESKFPVRYIPKKKHPDVELTQNSSKDSSLRNDMPISSNSNVRGPNTVYKRSNIRTQKSTSGLSLDVEHEFNQERFRSEELRWDHKGVKELPICKVGVQDQLFEDNTEINYHYGATEADHLDVPEEVTEELHDYDMTDLGKKGRLKTSRDKQDAEKLVVELLAKRAFTAVELRKKLDAKRFPPNVVQAVIHDFQVRGLINDRLYAETFSQSRWSSSSWGPRRIKHALSKKGVSENDVVNAVKLVFEDNEDDDRKSSLKLSNSTIEQLYIQAYKQWQRSQNVPHETRKARVIRWLQYRGFDWGVVSFILKKLESQHPP